MRDELDSCKWLYLRELGEPKDNTLRLVVEEARADGPPEDIEILGKVISGTRAVVSDDGCRLYELIWTWYVTYSVRNETFCTADASEEWEGRLFCLYSKSHFLDYVSRATIATAEYPGPLRHWGINCLNHIIDVVSSTEPIIRRLSPLGTPE